VIVWLCEKKLEKLTKAAKAAIEESDLLISPMVLLELQYLFELKRIVQPAQALAGQLEAEIGLTICDHPFPLIVEKSLLESWTRDPFDRMIVAHARANRYSPLVTSDEKIRDHYSKAIWS
jgi:PIN domain nuclease of toxin-antitoxin system